MIADKLHEMKIEYDYERPLEGTARSGISRNVTTLTVPIDSASEELDRVVALIREIKGHRREMRQTGREVLSFRPNVG